MKGITAKKPGMGDVCGHRMGFKARFQGRSSSQQHHRPAHPLPSEWPKWAHGKAPEIEKTATGDQSTEVKVQCLERAKAGEQPPYKIPSSQAYSPCTALIPRGVVLAARLSLSLLPINASHLEALWDRGKDRGGKELIKRTTQAIEITDFG